MKKQTLRRLANFPLSSVMITSAIVGVIGVPALWLNDKSPKSDGT